MSELTLLQVKQALWDERFRNLFPEYKKEIDGFINNPGCTCNVDLYKKLMQHKDRMKLYFPTKEIDQPIKVINCHINDLESQLRKVSKIHKHTKIAVARWQDQVTVILE